MLICFVSIKRSILQLYLHLFSPSQLIDSKKYLKTTFVPKFSSSSNNSINSGILFTTFHFLHNLQIGTISQSNTFHQAKMLSTDKHSSLSGVNPIKVRHAVNCLWRDNALGKILGPHFWHFKTYPIKIDYRRVLGAWQNHATGGAYPKLHPIKFSIGSVHFQDVLNNE